MVCLHTEILWGSILRAFLSTGQRESLPQRGIDRQTPHPILCIPPVVAHQLASARKKPADSSHWLSLTTMPGEDRESKQARLALSPNPCPRPVLRPEGFALPGPLRRPADPDSPGRIANSFY